MTKEILEEILVEYGMQFTDALADRLMKEFEALEAKPCEDCISRQAAIRIAEQGQVQGYEWQFKELIKLSSITPAQKIGHWIAQDICNCHTTFRCSECDYLHSFLHLYGKPTADYAYCPNCGAKMVELQESER